MLQVGARGTKREEPDFTTEPDEPYEAEPAEVRYGPHRLEFGDS